MATNTQRRRRQPDGADPSSTKELPKTPSGIQGLDEITGGGLPSGRPTLVCGGAGCGKTLFAMEFLVRGATEYGEPGVFMAFEETAEELAANVTSLGFDLKRLEAQKKLAIDYVRVERSEIEETGEYDLEGLFARLDYAIKSVGAKRVVLDTIESLFAGLPNPLVLRSELRRMFRWLKERGMTVVLTGEKGEGTLTRQGLEEYVSDCVHLPRPPGDRADLDPPTARGEVPGLDPWHQRIPVPDRRERYLDPARHLSRPDPQGVERAHLVRNHAPG